MPKYHKIRWQKSDEQELIRVVRNYNAKIKRLAKNPSKLHTDDLKALGVSENRIINALPETTSVKALKELIGTRQDLNRELNALRRFSRRGSEKIVVIPDNDYNTVATKWQKTEMSRSIGIINRRRKKRLEELTSLEMTSRGEELGYTLGQIGMGTVEQNSLQPMNPFPRSMDQTGLKKKYKAILTERQSHYFTERDFEVRENYLKGIRTHYDWTQIEDIYDYIEKMDIKEFFKVFNREGSTFDIASPNGLLSIKSDEYLSYQSALREIWLPNTGETSKDIIRQGG